MYSNYCQLEAYSRVPIRVDTAVRIGREGMDIRVVGWWLCHSNSKIGACVCQEITLTLDKTGKAMTLDALTQAVELSISVPATDQRLLLQGDVLTEEDVCELEHGSEVELFDIRYLRRVLAGRAVGGGSIDPVAVLQSTISDPCIRLEHGAGYVFLLLEIIPKENMRSTYTGSSLCFLTVIATVLNKKNRCPSSGCSTSLCTKAATALYLPPSSAGGKAKAYQGLLTKLVFASVVCLFLCPPCPKINKSTRYVPPPYRHIPPSLSR